MECATFDVKVQDVLNLSNKETLARAIFYGVVGLYRHGQPIASVSSHLLGFGGNMSLLLVLWQGGVLTSEGLITIGDLSAFLLYTAYVGLSISGVASFWSELMKV